MLIGQVLWEPCTYIHSYAFNLAEAGAAAKDREADQEATATTRGRRPPGTTTPPTGSRTTAAASTQPTIKTMVFLPVVHTITERY